MFEKYQFKNYIYRALADLGFLEPTAVQKIVIPKVLNGDNVIAKSQTGTGKTHAFLLPLLNNLPDESAISVLILTPTRELGYQLYNETVKIIKHAPHYIDVRLYVGGSDREREIKRLEKSQPQIAIGTVGKIADLAVKSNLLKIHTVKTIVFDEADMIFETDRLKEVNQIVSCLDAGRQFLVFSATANYGLRDFLNKYLTEFEMVDLTARKLTKSSIEHIFIPTKNKDKTELLKRLLSTFHPLLALIFVNTKVKANTVSTALAAAGYAVAKISGDMPPRHRRRILRRIKSGAYQYVVATDLAARGLDIPGISHVINYELPADIDFFVHRTGRTGRFDLTGTSFSLYDYEDDFYLNKLKAKGLNCVYKTIKDGALVTLPVRRSRSTKSKSLTPAENLHRSVPMPNKVKPGYRKKRKEEIEKKYRRQRRRRIEDIYRRKAHKK